MRFTIVAFLFCLTSSIANAQQIFEVSKPMKCADVHFLMQDLTEEYKEKLLWVGKTESDASYIAIMQNKENGTWTVIQYDSKIGCVLGVGRLGSAI